MEVHNFGSSPVSCHTWSKDKSQLALSPNNNKVLIYKKASEKWTEPELLSQHDLRVTSMDWAPNTNRIVTCSADRNAYVWTQCDGKWKPTLVLLRSNRAATCVRWSPRENKFAVGSGGALVAICYFEEENDWWVSKHIKKPIMSTVTSLDWHPNNILLATGSTDFRVRVFSAYIKEIEQKPQPTPWGNKMPFGNVMAEVSNAGGGWIHCVSFSTNGNKLAWVSHNSTISVVDAEADMKLVTLRTQYLPFITCLWSSEDSIVAAGYDCSPMVFQYNKQGQLSFVERLGKSQKKETDGFSAMRKFRDMDKCAVSNGSVDDTALDSIHQNSITDSRVHSVGKTGVTKFSTVGLDGKLVIWDIETLEATMTGLRIR
ncbi:actin-related protein 2/3 complex subunit 1A-like isoform X2 [Tachypleus tridentatus]|uniref:actin-related protein 2/3 complex subunit 1A-like isoform X2 n=1 Tax=Tachypleus tridentatus TaxID=6853 RepID=UPI003FCF2206